MSWVPWGKPCVLLQFYNLAPRFPSLRVLAFRKGPALFLSSVAVARTAPSQSPTAVRYDSNNPFYTSSGSPEMLSQCRYCRMGTTNLHTLPSAGPFTCLLWPSAPETPPYRQHGSSRHLMYHRYISMRTSKILSRSDLPLFERKSQGHIVQASLANLHSLSEVRRFIEYRPSRCLLKAPMQS